MGDHKFLTGFTWYKIVWQKHTFKVQEMKKDNFIDFVKLQKQMVMVKNLYEKI